jgi:hypothetical protein
MSFRLSFHQALLGPTAVHWLDDALTVGLALGAPSGGIGAGRRVGAQPGQSPGPSAAGQLRRRIVVQQCPDPERLLALAGMVRTLEHNWELDFYGPRGFAKARVGERPRIDPEQVRQVEEPAPVGIAAAVTLAGWAVRRVGRRPERAGRLPTPVRRP